MAAPVKADLAMNDELALWRGFDAVGFDLDGVLYRGTSVVASAAATLARLRQCDVKIGFVTNNAQRGPAEICHFLDGFGITATPEAVVTSAQATAHLMATSLPPGSTVMCLGSQALSAEIAAVGLHPVAPGPRLVDAVCLGFDPSLSWADLNEGCYAVQGGAAYYACNDDCSRPTDRGTAVGTGGILAAMAGALPSVIPIKGGKPTRPLLDEAKLRLGAKQPLFVGDRLDTDMAGAYQAGWASLMVLTGTHGPADLVQAHPGERPTFVAADVAGLLEHPRLAVPQGLGWRCGEAQAYLKAGQIVVEGNLAELSARLDALWAVAQLAWQLADSHVEADASNALSRLGVADGVSSSGHFG